MQHVQHRHRVGFCRVGANVQSDLAVLHVVVRVGHGAITPGVGHTGHGGGVANTGLVVAVVATEVAHKLAQQIGLFVIVLRRANPVNAVWARSLAQLKQLGADFVQGRVPANALVLAVDQLHGVTQAELTVAVLTQGCTFGAMRTEVDGGIKYRFLTHPNAVFNDSVYRATHRAVGTHGALDFNLAGATAGERTRCIGFFNQAQLRRSQAHTNTQTRAAQKATTVKGRQSL